MKIVYMGTPRFAVPPLEALLAAGHDITGVVTRIDKPAGRGMVLTPPPVKTAARAAGIAVHQPRRVRDAAVLDLLSGLRPEVLVVAAYGQILPKEILTLPRFGCVNIHASLLPKYRGAAPINWAIIRGETETGVTIMQMDEGMDTGGVLSMRAIPIGPGDTTGAMTERLSLLGAELIVEALPLIESGALRPRPQDHSGATMAPMLKKEDGLIDWRLTAGEIRNRVRGLWPWPGAYTHLDGKLVKLIEADAAEGAAGPGELASPAADTLTVGTGRGLLRIVALQPEGKKPMTAAEFLRGHRNLHGKRFESVKREG